MLTVAYAYDKGEGINQNSEQADFWYKKRFNAKHKEVSDSKFEAMRDLAFIYEQSKGVAATDNKNLFCVC